MKPRILGRFLMAGALLASAGFVGAADRSSASVPSTNGDIAKEVRHEIVMYPYYTLWDDISFRVADNGTVELMGAVSQPYKKVDIERLVRRLPGVSAVKDDITVLPVSFEDDRLRLRVARAIYSEPTLQRYALQAVPPIHIIVENGHVRLEGVVNNQFEKNLAGLRAAGAGLSFGPVVNNLEVESPAKRS